LNIRIKNKDSDIVFPIGSAIVPFPQRMPGFFRLFLLPGQKQIALMGDNLLCVGYQKANYSAFPTRHQFS
jgi:hypothetical protein